MRIYSLIAFCLFANVSYAVHLSRELSASTIPQNGDLIVRVSINKSGVDGIGKLVEEIPAGFDYEIVNSASGKVLTDEQGRLKIIWLTLPIADRFDVSYRLIHRGKTKGDYLIKGHFSYVQNTLKKDYEIVPTKLNINELSTIGISKGEKEEVKGQKRKSESSAPEIEVKKNKNAYSNGEVRPDSTKVEEQKVLPIVSEATGNYVIQLGVYSSEKDRRIFKGLPDIHYARVKQFYKYYSGHYPTKEAANKRLKEAKKAGFTEAFVTELKP